MRETVSIVVAVALSVVILFLAFSGSVVPQDFWTGISIALVTLTLGVLYWGFKPRIDKFFTKERDFQKDKTATPLLKEEESPKNELIQTETEPSKEKKISRRGLLADTEDISKLDIENDFLDQIYGQAHNQAIHIYYDAQLSHFIIQVWPFAEVGANVNIYFDFHSKWVDKTCSFRYSDANPQVEHSLPDMPAKSDFDRRSFAKLPWKESPQWIHFLNRAYIKIKPLVPASKTRYHLSAGAYNSPSWRLTFDDGFTGNDFVFEWNGKGLDENSIKQV